MVLAAGAMAFVMLNLDDMQFFWWLFYEGVIQGKFYGPCVWPDDFMDHENATLMYNLEYDEELGYYPKHRSGDEITRQSP